MTRDTELGDMRELMLEDWVDVFGRIYSAADADRDASSLWLDVLEESSNVAEYVRREEYRKAIDTIPDVFGRLLSFVAKYSVNAADADIDSEGIDLRPEGEDEPYLTGWVLKKYPSVCSVCAQKPCICPSSRYEKETRNEDFRVGEVISARLAKHKVWENEIVRRVDSFTVEALFDMFNNIYSGVQHDPPISSICFHFLEEVGEVANLLLSFNNIQILKTKNGGSYGEALKHLNSQLKDEISDVVSWVMALINKVNFVFRSTYPHYHCILDTETADRPVFRRVTLSELMVSRFYDPANNIFVCPHCGAEECSPQCRENRLIAETENRMKREHDLLQELRKALGQERRKSPRTKTQITTELDNGIIKIVDIGRDNVGFLSHTLLSLNDEREIIIPPGDREERLKLKITRPCNADTGTGFEYFYGAEITDRTAA